MDYAAMPLLVLRHFGEALASTLPITLVTAAVFTIVSLIAARGSRTPWWRKRGLVTDLTYIAVLPGIAGYARSLMLVTGIVFLYHVDDRSGIDGFMRGGIGPLAGLPFWVEAGLYLLISDLVMYTTHRVLHGRRLWSFHAVHHSSEDVDWISAYRVHPMELVFHSALADVVPMLLGVPAEVIVALVPFQVGSAALAHADLDWTFGPFRYVLASPVFHRWHHTSPRQGGNTNFAATFPFIDLLFGTFHMPVGEVPTRFGVPNIPDDFTGQIMHPFRRTKSAKAVT